MPDSDVSMWAAVAGFLSGTFVLPLINVRRWSKLTKSAVIFAWCAVVGLVSTWLAGGFDKAHDARSAATAVLLTLVAAIAMYGGNQMVGRARDRAVGRQLAADADEARHRLNQPRK